MAPGKHRRPLLDGPELSPAQNVEDDYDTDGLDDRDVVEEFVAKRHEEMANALERDGDDSDDNENQPETTEYDVLNLGTSDSDQDDFESADEDDSDAREVEEKDDWGGSRKNWYGGDTHEYEIMEHDEREELLKDEEEEAIRLQKKALQRIRPEDYLQDEQSDSGDDDLQDEADLRAKNEAHVKDSATSVPELELLIKEFQKVSAQLRDLKENPRLNEIDRMNYQLLGLFVTNVAFYFALRTDPNAVGMDLRTHPVLSRIIQIRSLLRNVQSVAVQTLEKRVVGKTESQKRARSGEKGTADQVPILQNSAEVSERGELRKKKGMKKRKKKTKETNDILSVEADERRVQHLLRANKSEVVFDEGDAVRERKRRKLNQIVGAMERDRKNMDAKRMASADLDLVREEVRNAKNATNVQGGVMETYDQICSQGLEDDEDVMTKMLARKDKKEARKARKAAASAPHVYRFKDKVDPQEKRKASAQVIKNRGLSRYRPRDKKTPRTKNRLAYGKAVVRRKGAVREYAGASGGSYGGEASGINMSARKSSTLW